MSVSQGQVEIAVNVDGAERAVNQFKELEATANNLDGRKVKITADTNLRDINRQIGELDRKQFEYKLSFSRALEESKRLTKQIQGLEKPIEQAAGRMTHWGYGIKRGLAPQFDVLTKNGEEVGLAFQHIKNANKQLGVSLKDSSRVFKGRVRQINDISHATQKYFGLMERQTDLELQRSNLGVDWDKYYNTLNKFKTAREGLMATKESYQALSKEEDVQNKLATSMSHVTDNYKAFQSQLSTMNDSSALVSINGKMEQLGKVMDSIKMKRAELGLPTGSEEGDYANKLESDRLGKLLKVFAAENMELGKQRDAILEVDKAQKQLETDLVRGGSRLQSLGNAIQRVTSPFMNVFRGIAYGVGYQALNTAMSGMASGFQRYDTMKTYPRMMAEYETKTYTAKQSVEELNQSVLGLPTGLDEIVGMAQRYTLSLGDMQRGTKLAIATNNAFLASMATDTQKYQGMLQLQDLMNGKELQPREWMSLGASMGKAINEVAKVMGAKTQDDIRQFRKQLYAGKVDIEQFLDALVKVGTDGGAIEKLAANAKLTWEAFSDNLKNANARLVQGLLDTLDTVFEQYTGKTFLKNMQELTKGIDGVSESLQKWVKAHPDEITKFFDDMKSVDWSGILSGFGLFAKQMAGVFSTFMKVAGGKNGIQFMLWGNIVGKIISLWGSLQRGLAGPISKAIMKGGIMAYITDWVKNLPAISKFSKLFKGAKDIEKTGKAMEEAGTAVEGMALSWQGVASKAVSVAAIPAMAWSLKEVALAFQEFDKVHLSWGLVGKITVAAAAISAFIGLSGALGALMVSGPFGWLSTGSVAIGGTAIAGISKAMKWLGEGLNAIANADLPTTARIKHVMDAMNEIEGYFKARNPIEAIGKVFDAWTKTHEFKAIKSVGDAFEAVSSISTYKLPKGWKNTAIKRFSKLKEVVAGFEKDFINNAERGEAVNGRPSRYGGYTTESQSMSSKLQAFADSMTAVGTAVEQMVGIVDNAILLNDKLNGIKGKLANSATKGEKNLFSWTALRKNIDGMVSELYQFVLGKENGKGYEYGPSMMEQLKAISDGFKGVNLEQVFTQLDFVPQLISKLTQINQRIAADTRGLINGAGTGSYSGVYGKLKPYFDEIAKLPDLIPENISGFKGIKSINSALNKIKTTVDRLRQLSNLNTEGISLANIQSLAGKIKEALGEFEDVGDKEIKINLKADISGQDKVKEDITKEIGDLKREILNIDAIVRKIIYVDFEAAQASGTSGVIAQVRQKIADIIRRIKELPASATKPVHVNFVGGGGGHAAINAHTGGFITPYGPLYRANGGSIFKPIGTDTVPSMLTPGEYVMRTRAVRTFGIGLMQRLNHLDIHGALNALALRAGQSLATSTAGVVNNTTNNTRNANLTMTFNHAPAGVGLSRANRFVKSL